MNDNIQADPEDCTVMPQPTIPITPAILQWAREEAGLSLEAAAERAKINTTRKTKKKESLTPAQRLEEWEQGRSTPTLKQLSSLATAYRRPLVTFFLPQPPEKAGNFIDFRKLPNNASAPVDTPEFAALKRRIILLQRELLSLAKEEKQPELSFVGSMSLKNSAQQIADNIRETLNIPFQKQKEIANKNSLLKTLREAIHEAGIFVLFLGNLGSHHSNILPEEFRGIAIADKIAPVIVVNQNDAKAAMVFTLAHELAHVWLGTTSISNIDFFANTHQAHKEEEILCNKVAAAFLMPKKEFLMLVSNIMTKESYSDQEIREIAETVAQEFKVSGAAAGRRMKDLGCISGESYSKLLSQYQCKWKNNNVKSNKTNSGPSRNVLDAYYFGRKTIETFVYAAYDGRISLQEASRILNIPVSRFEKVLS